MAIQALPPATVRTLGASQVLNDAAAVVKELLDNGIDAHATSVAIEISSNTLDSIQVRDNGHGIPALDRNLVARPHCTSKIDGTDDLKDIGGSSLGFRGEALASIAELSGSLTISTRVEGEQVAAILKINKCGEVEGQDRASLPIGTTVKASDFMISYPVRKQMALKNAEKTLVKIKHMLQCYAFARPNVRISMRVLKAKNDSGNWVYASKAGATAEDVALKIAGTRCVSQCTWSVIEESGFTLQAFLPKRDADASKVSNIGCFLSIDSRPISTSKGTPKKIAKLFRELLRKANSSFENVKAPFIYLSISCPRASYDANVEPAKDDVLFEDPILVLKVARQLFEALYLDPVVEASTTEDLADRNPSQRAGKLHMSRPRSLVTKAALDRLSNDSTFASTDLDVSCDSRRPAPPSVSDDLGRDTSNAQYAIQAFRSNMYGCDEEDLDLIDVRPPTGRTEADFGELRQAREDINLSNPWVIAKLNAPTRRSATLYEDSQNLRIGMATSEANDLLAFQTQPTIALEAPSLPTPRASSPSLPHSSFHPSDHVPHSRFARDGRMIGSGILPPPQMLIEFRSSQPVMSKEIFPRQHLRQAPVYDYILSPQAANHIPDTALRKNLDASQTPRADRKQHPQCEANPPYKPPMRSQQWNSHVESGGYRKRRKSVRPSRDIAGLVIQGELGDLLEDPRPLTPPVRNRDIRDFVQSVDLTADNSVASLSESSNYPHKMRTRSFDSALGRSSASNEENTRATTGVISGSGFIPANELAALEARIGTVNKDRAKPVKRRKTSEGRALREISTNLSHRGDMEDRDQQAKHVRRTASCRYSTFSSSNGRRTKSAQLPLERTPLGQGVQDVVSTLFISEQEIARLSGKIDEECSVVGWKEPFDSKYAGFATKPSSRTISQWTASLHKLLINRVSDSEMVQDLGDLVSDAFDTLNHASDGIFVV